MKFNKLALVVISAFGFSAIASAHTIWVSKVHGEQAVNYGHSGTNTDAYDPSKVISAVGYKNDGSTVDLTVKKDDNHAALADIPEDVGIVVVKFDNGYWSQNKDGEWINKRGDQVEGADSSRKISKETVAYLNPRIKPMPANLKLEIIPEVNPATLKKGDELKAKVLFNGKPLEGAEVTNNYFDHDAKTATTDKDGFVVLPVADEDFNIWEVGNRIKSDDPYENEGYSSSLSFNAKSDHHHH